MIEQILPDCTTVVIFLRSSFQKAWVNHVILMLISLGQDPTEADNNALVHSVGSHHT